MQPTVRERPPPLVTIIDMAKLLDMAYSWIWTHQQQAKQQTA